MKPVLFHSEARSELREAVTYYEQQRAGLGLALSSAVEAAVETIRRSPRVGAPYKATEFRHLVVRRFPYVVYYLELEEAIWIAAVAHGKRRPGYWKQRRME